MSVTKIPSTGIDQTTDFAFTGTVSGAGRVLQQQFANFNLSGASTTSTSYVATDITDSITPSSTSSKIMITAQVPMFVKSSQSSGGANWFARGHIALYRDSTQFIDNTSMGGSGYTTSSYNYGHVEGYATWSWLDSPSTTSAVAYKIYVKLSTLQGTGQVEYNGPSSISLMEMQN
tara:strand:+ start:1099 stop:1623 length:525 start_codon:yes stop_codon:yes gene_type:complete